MDAKRWRKTLAYLIFLSIMGIALTACTSMNATSGGSSADGGAKTASPTVYRDFSDILLPNDMKIDPKRTYIVEGPGMTTGILTIKGWVDRNSLMTFFKSAMQRDQWQELASFKSPTPKTSSILVFQKAGRIAVISIDEGWIYTYAEIAVAPSVSGGGSGMLQDNELQ